MSFWVVYTAKGDAATATIAESAVKPAPTPGIAEILGPYKTRAEAQSVIGKLGKVSKVATPKSPLQNLVPHLPGLPSLQDTRDLVIRVVKVVVGVALIIIGLAEIAKPGQILSKLPPVIPV